MWFPAEARRVTLTNWQTTYWIEWVFIKSQGGCGLSFFSYFTSLIKPLFHYNHVHDYGRCTNQTKSLKLYEERSGRATTSQQTHKWNDENKMASIEPTPRGPRDGASRVSEWTNDRSIVHWMNRNWKWLKIGRSHFALFKINFAKILLIYRNNGVILY